MGKTNNPNGRPAGKPNKITTECRKIIKNAIENDIDKIPELMKKLEPKDRLNVLVKILPYLLPKLEPVQDDYYEEQEGEPDLIKKLTKNQLSRIREIYEEENPE